MDLYISHIVIAHTWQ